MCGSREFSFAERPVSQNIYAFYLFLLRSYGFELKEAARPRALLSSTSAVRVYFN